MKFLIVGNFPTKNSLSIGGATILLDNLYAYIVSKVEVKRVITNKFYCFGGLFLSYFYIYAQFILKINKCSIVMINTSEKGTFYLAPYLYILARLFRKKVVFRAFGGNLKERYENAGVYIQWLLEKTIFKSDLFCLETIYLINFMQKHSKNLFWFPNVRVKPPTDSIHTEKFHKRFVFISQIIRTKGVAEIIEATEEFDNSYTFDIYGPVLDRTIDLKKTVNCKYKGVLKPECVIKTLSQYDVLLLPTYHYGEGYPGIIIEGYSVGIPVITTNWLCIPEIVIHGTTGFLIDPKDVRSLNEAIKHFTIENYPGFNKSALKMFEKFDSEKVNRKFLDACCL